MQSLGCLGAALRTALLIVYLIPGIDFAADMPSVGESAAGIQLQEVVVTARKRAETLSNIPVAVTALSGAQLDAQGIDRIDKISGHVPNLTFQPGAPTGSGPSTPSVFIRGIGSSETSLGTEAGVGLYVDDVYIARSVGSVLDLTNVDSVQVLRGPQGTLFGRNNVGGAIVIRSAPLSATPAGSLRLSVGNQNHREIRGNLDMPFGDSVRTRLAGIASFRNGYVKNVDSSDARDDFGRTDRIGVSAALEWRPQDSVVITLRGDHSRDQGTAPPSVLLGLVPTIPGTNTPSMIQALSNLKGTCFGASVLGNSGNPDCIDQQWILGPYRSHSGYATSNAIFDSQGSEAYANRTRAVIGGGSMTVAWALNDATNLKSVTAYRNINAFWPSNSDHSPDPGIETKVDFREHQFTEELQLLGQNFSDRMKWILGGYYLDEAGSELNVVAFPAVIFRSGGGYATKSSALFAQSSIEVTDALEMTGGVRYTHERKSYDTLSNQEIIGVLMDPFSRQFMDLRATPIPFVTGSTPDIKSEKTSPYLSAKYRFNPSWMIYASVSDGYKSGGYEQRLAPGTQEVPRFGPERVRMIELGTKARLLNGRASVELALFRSKYKDMQITVVDGVAPTMTNAGDATIKGGELEIGVTPIEGLQLDVNSGYLDASYDRLTDRAFASGIHLNSELPNTPRFQWGISGEYRARLPTNLLLIPRLDWSYRSHLFVDSANTPILRQAGVGLLNAGLSLADSADRWSVTLSGRNLTNRDVLVAGLAQYSIGEIEGTYGPPRQWDLSMNIKF